MIRYAVVFNIHDELVVLGGGCSPELWWNSNTFRTEREAEEQAKAVHENTRFEYYIVPLEIERGELTCGAKLAIMKWK